MRGRCRPRVSWWSGPRGEEGFTMRTYPLGAAVLGLWSLSASAGPVFDVTSSADIPDLAIDGVCNTTSDNAHPVCTLRAAVMEANLGPNPGAEEVTINLPAGSYNFTRAI